MCPRVLTFVLFNDASKAHSLYIPSIAILGSETLKTLVSVHVTVPFLRSRLPVNFPSFQHILIQGTKHVQIKTSPFSYVIVSIESTE
jgi:hypothetical protein